MIREINGSNYTLYIRFLSMLLLEAMLHPVASPARSYNREPSSLLQWKAQGHSILRNYWIGCLFSRIWCEI